MLEVSVSSFRPAPRLLYVASKRMTNSIRPMANWCKHCWTYRNS